MSHASREHDIRDQSKGRRKGREGTMIKEENFSVYSRAGNTYSNVILEGKKSKTLKAVVIPSNFCYKENCASE